MTSALAQPSAGTGAPGAAATQQFCTFEVHGHCFGVRVEAVQEVIRYQQTTRVPLAPAAIGGLINLRGQVITAIDLRERLSFPCRAADELPMNVVVRTPDGAVSLLVDRIGAVIDVPGELFEPPPDTVPEATRELIHGAYKLDDRLLLALDVARAVDVAVRS